MDRMDACKPRRPMPPWLRYGLYGCGAGVAILAAMAVHSGALPWRILVGVVVTLAAMLLLP